MQWMQEYINKSSHSEELRWFNIYVERPCDQSYYDSVILLSNLIFLLTYDQSFPEIIIL